TNAMHYGAGKPVQIRVSSRPDAACIEVRDHGIGISQKSLERIFHQFERAEGSESSAGLGLGLFIAEQIVKAHGGCIQVESREGEGALFRVTLPLQARAQALGRATDLQMLAPLGGSLCVSLHTRLLVEGAAEHGMQLAYRLVVALLGGFDGLLGQVVAQNVFRVGRLHARLARSLVGAFAFTALTISLRPAVE